MPTLPVWHQHDGATSDGYPHPPELLFSWQTIQVRSAGNKKEEIQVDFAEGDTVVVTGGAWKDTVGVIESINEERQTLTIRVELFGRETPVELAFTEVKKM